MRGLFVTVIRRRLASLLVGVGMLLTGVDALAQARPGGVPASTSPRVRIKEIADLQGMRDNEVFGYGLVIGLSGTGDTEQALFTQQSISGMLGRLGVRIDPRDVRVRNVAAVMVTARMPTFARPGTHLDVSVGAIGNARSLEGGVLLVTPLKAGDGKVYAVAQGPVQVGGFAAQAANLSMRKNQPNSGRIPGGATIERAVTPKLTAEGPVAEGEDPPPPPQVLTLQLRRPDFTTASRIAQTLRAQVAGTEARALDSAAVELQVPEAFRADVVPLIAQIEATEIESDQRARVVVSERTGTVVAGDKVRIRPVAIAHGGLQVAITSTPVVSQPNPFGQGNTVAGATSEADAKEGANPVVALEATTTVADLATQLNKLGVTPRDLVAILQAIKAAGALDGELDVL